MFNRLSESCLELRETEAETSIRVSNQNKVPEKRQRAKANGHYSKKNLPSLRCLPCLARGFFSRVFLFQEFCDPCCFAQDTVRKVSEFRQLQA